MRWHPDKDGGQWTATVTPEGVVRLLRQTVKPPYREGGEPSVEYQTVEFEPSDAMMLGKTLGDASDAAATREVS